MGITNEIIKKISKSKAQYRVTVPKEWKTDYVVLKPLELNIFKSRKKYVK